MKLRPYQSELIEKVKVSLKSGKKKICVVLGCGGGKSVIIGNIIKGATEKKNQVLFLVHRIELVEQITNTLKACNVNMNYCKVGMMQTIVKNLNKIIIPKLIVIDEAHHSASTTYKTIINHFKDSIVIGFSATPTRLGSGGLGNIFEDLIQGVNTQWLIKNGYLSKYKYYSVKLADTDKIKVIAGDYDKKQVNTIMENGAIYGDTLKTWQDKAKNKKTIIYCSSVVASKETVNEFIGNGIKAAHIDAKTPEKERKKMIDKFRIGEITVLSNVDLFGEGFDVPDCECVILLRPTKSLTVFIQQSMRSMRIDPKNPKKEAIIIDHVRNVFEHGFPDDDRIWTLKTKNKKENNVLIRECSMCYMVCDAKEKKCPYCGYEFANNSEGKTKEVQKIEIELQELKRQENIKMLNYNEYKNIKTFEDMREFQKLKKYKFGWCLRKCEELGIYIPSEYNYMRRFLR